MKNLITIMFLLFISSCYLQTTLASDDERMLNTAIERRNAIETKKAPTTALSETVTSAVDDSSSENNTDEVVVEDSSLSPTDEIDDSNTLSADIDVDKLFAEEVSSVSKSGTSIKDVDLKSLVQTGLEKIAKKEKLKNSKPLEKIDTKKIAKDQEKFKQEHIGFEGSNTTFLPEARKGQKGAIKYERPSAPAKIGIMGPASIGKTTYLDDFIKLMGLPKSNVHTISFENDQITVPYEEVIHHGINRGDHSLPHVFVYDEFFRLKKFSDLTKEQQTARVKSIDKVHDLLGNGSFRVKYNKTPKVALVELSTKMQSISEKESAIEVLKAKKQALIEKRVDTVEAVATNDKSKGASDDNAASSSSKKGKRKKDKSKGKDSESVVISESTVIESEINKLKSQKDTLEVESITIINKMREEYPQIFGKARVKTDESIMKALKKHPQELLSYFIHQSENIDADGTEKIYPHVIMIYAGLLPLYSAANKEFEKLPQKQKTLSGYQESIKKVLAKEKCKDVDQYFTKWVKTYFYPDIKDDDVQRLGLNKSIISIAPFSDIVWRKIVTKETIDFFATDLLDTGMAKEKVNNIDFQFDERSLNLVIEDVIQPNMGRRNLKQLIGKYFSALSTELATAINKVAEADPKNILTQKTPLKVTYDTKKMLLSVYDSGGNLWATSDMKNFIEERVDTVDLSTESLKNLQRAVFIDVSTRAMKSVPKELLQKGPLNLSDFSKLWEQESVNVTENWKKYLIALTAKKFATKIIWPKKVMDKDVDYEYESTDLLIETMIKNLNENTTKIVEGDCNGKLKGCKFIEEDAILKLIYLTPKNKLTSGTTEYIKIIELLEENAKLRVLQNQDFILKLQQALTDKSVSDATTLHEFYKNNLPKKSDIKFSQYMSEQFHTNVSEETDDKTAKKVKDTRTKILSEVPGTAVTGLNQQIKQKLSKPGWWARNFCCASETDFID
ncbi:MAG: hypothetical protein HQK51_13220 [Oligoflexia bacterium]|nr:hypothetical protein [Oligoflexia bacterium]